MTRLNLSIICSINIKDKRRNLRFSVNTANEGARKKINIKIDGKNNLASFSSSNRYST